LFAATAARWCFIIGGGVNQTIGGSVSGIDST